MVTVGAVLVVTPHSLFEGFECNYRLDSPLSVLVRCDTRRGHFYILHKIHYAQLMYRWLIRNVRCARAGHFLLEEPEHHGTYRRNYFRERFEVLRRARPGPGGHLREV
jgi:hypothetical protein